MKFLLSLIILFSTIQLSVSQNDFLGHKMSEEERAEISNYIESIKERTILTDPPIGPVRAMAEWEEVGKVQVSWKYYGQTAIKNILIQIIDEVKDVCEVVIVCDNASTVQNALTSEGVDWSQNVTFITEGANSIWCRDYGANPVYLNDVDSLVLVDWIYNRPRPLDDQVPLALSNHYNIPFYETNVAPNDLVNTGGNFMTDGMGLAICEDLILEENGPNNQWGTSNHSEAEVDEIMFQYMGIDRYVKMEKLPHDEIHHVDMHMKLLDEERILVGEFPTGVSDGPTIESNIEDLQQNVLTAFGDTFEIIRMPMPPYFGNYHYAGNNIPYRTYTNALFVNSKILVPAYEEAYDTIAQRIWEEVKPGYDIVMIDCNSIINYLGAIHCITKEMGVAEPLLINVDQHSDVHGSTPGGYPILARIKHKSGIDNATLYYRYDDGDYSSINMNTDNSCDDCYSANIPQINTGLVQYYVDANSTSGKHQVYPIVAPAGYLEFEVTSIVNLESINDISFSIYPNPAQDFLSVSIKEPIDKLQILTAGGKIVEEISVSNNNLFKIELKHYSPGIFFVKVSIDNKEQILKFVKD